MTKVEKRILITFDYELFLGKESGSVKNCLITPTNEIVKVLNNYKLKSIFFVDTLYLYQLKLKSIHFKQAEKDYILIKNQLRQLISYGHHLFHHIHPHWLDAVYIENTNQWDLSDKKKFALSNLEKVEVEEVFRISRKILDEIYEGFQPPVFWGIRAGGLYAQPLNHYLNCLIEHNIRIDSSVLKKAHSESISCKFDYTNSPISDIYKCNDDILLEDPNGCLIEISMESFNIKGINRVFNSLFFRFNNKKKDWQKWGDGMPSGNVVRSKEKKEESFISKISEGSYETYSVELLNNFKSYLYFKELNNKEFINLISHPKLVSPANLKAFDLFIRKANEKYIIKSDVFEIITSNNINISS